MLFSKLFQLFADFLHALGCQRIDNDEDSRDNSDTSRNPTHQQLDTMDSLFCLYGTFFCIEAESSQKPKELEAFCDNEKFGYLFRSSKLLCELLAVKFDLGVKTREAYKDGKEAVLALLPLYDEVYNKVCEYFEVFRELWYTENKGNGFEVQAIRYGGLKERLIDCKRRLSDFANGKISVIEELEEDIKAIHTAEDLKENKYGKITTVNTLTHYGFGGF